MCPCYKPALSGQQVHCLRLSLTTGLTLVTAGMSRRVTSFTLTNMCSWQEDQSTLYAKPTGKRSSLRILLDKLYHSVFTHAAESGLPLYTPCHHKLQAMLHAQQLFAAAELLVRQSCQEAWLLQPYIPDIQEYRCFSSCSCRVPMSSPDKKSVVT